MIKNIWNNYSVVLSNTIHTEKCILSPSSKQTKKYIFTSKYKNILFLVLNNPFWLFMRCTIVLLSFIFIPLWLKWNVAYFSILVILTLGTILSLLVIYNSSNYTFYYNSDMLAIFTGYYLYIAEKAIANSSFNDTFLSINVTIGLSMIILGLINSQETQSLHDKFLFITKNKDIFFIFGLAMVFVIFTVNILLFLVGLGILVETGSITLFIYTFFSKVISIKLILLFIFCSITKEFKLHNVSLSLSSVIFMILLGSANYYYVIPYVKVIMSLGLTKLYNIFTQICLLVENSTIKTDYHETLTEGIYNILVKFPIIGRYLELFKISHKNYKDIHSPFRMFYHNPFKYKVNIYPLAAISKFNNKFMFTIVENKLAVLHLYGVTVDSLELQWKKNYMNYTTALTYHLPFTYNNFACNGKLICSDQMVDIYSTVKNNSLELFYLERTNLEKFSYKSPNLYKGNSDIANLSSYKKSDNSFLASSYDSLDFIRNYHISPPNQNNSLQVFMQQGFSNDHYNYQQGFNSYDYSFQQGESSTVTGEHFNLNRGTKRSLESENEDIHENTSKSINYVCIEIKMIRLNNKDILFLSFDPTKFETEGDRYLDEICITGRTVLFDHYNSLMEDSMKVRRIVENVKFEDISISENIDGSCTAFYTAFMDKHRDRIIANNLELKNINLFSKVYLDDSPDYSDDNPDYSDNNPYYSDNHPDYSDDNLDYSNDHPDCSNDHPDCSNDDSNSVDYTEEQQNIFKQLPPREIQNLIDKLVSKQTEFFDSYKGSDITFRRCYLKNLGLFLEGGVIKMTKSENYENEITHVLNALINIKPDLFGEEIYQPKDGFRMTRVNWICSVLNRLLLPSQNLNGDLTEKDVMILTRELKSRARDLFNENTSNYIVPKDCILSNFGITVYKELVAINENENYIHNPFTELLNKVMINHPEFFAIIRGDRSPPTTRVVHLYSKLIDLTRKPLTKDEIHFIIDGLQSRTNRLLDLTILPANSSKGYVFKDLFKSFNELITEGDTGLESYEFTRLLENFIKEKKLHVQEPRFHPARSVEKLLRDLKTHVENLS